MRCGTVAPRDCIGQGIYPITATLRVPREPLESLGKSITTSPVPSYPFLEAGRDNDTEALGHVTDWTTEREVRRRIGFVTLGSRETPSEGQDGEEVRERVNER